MNKTNDDEGERGDRRMSRKTKRCIVLLCAAALLLLYIILRFAPIGERTLTVKALDKKSDIGQGSEIWIKSVVIDGVETPPEEVFSGTWLSDEGYLKWRNYDMPEGATDTLTATFPSGTEVDIRFQTNKWRGIARVKDGYILRSIYDVDCWSDTEAGDQLAYYRDRRMSLGIIRALRVVLIYVLIWAAVVLIRKRLAIRKQEPSRKKPASPSGAGT